MYFSRDKTSTTYPPVDTNFVNDSQAEQASSTQCLCSCHYSQGIIDKQFYGFEAQVYGPLKVFINGVDTNQTIQNRAGTSYSSAYNISEYEVIYGYTITPTTINLWTDPTYRDTSQPMMYGRRDLYCKPATDDIYDYTWTQANPQMEVKVAFMHVIYSYGLFLEKVTTSSGSFTQIRIHNGHDPSSVINPKFALKSRVISTGTVEQEITQIQDSVTGIEQQITDINAQIAKLIPDLTKLVSAEASKNYIAR